MTNNFIRWPSRQRFFFHPSISYILLFIKNLSSLVSRLSSNESLLLYIVLILNFTFLKSSGAYVLWF